MWPIYVYLKLFEAKIVVLIVTVVVVVVVKFVDVALLFVPDDNIFSRG